MHHNEGKGFSGKYLPSGQSFSLASAHLIMINNMAKDMKKEINLGYNKGLSYDTSHGGVSLFAKIGILVATANHCHHYADPFTRITNLTLVEVAMMDMTPDVIPTGYHATIDLPHCYIKFLRHLVGKRCKHHVEVHQIMVELNSYQYLLESLSARQISFLLWKNFVDARCFSSAGINI